MRSLRQAGGLWLLAGAVVLGGAIGAAAATLTVGPGKTYATISAAVGAASDGDTISVETALQTEDNITVGKAVTIKGLGMTNTTLQAQTTRGATNKIMFYLNGAGKIIQIQDMTLRYSSNSASGSAPCINISNNATGILQNCHITQNDWSWSYDGGAVRVNGACGIVTNCVFSSNICYNTGALCSIGASKLSVYNSTFYRNRGLKNSYNVGAGAIYVGGGTFAMVNSTVTENMADNYGGGFMFGVSGSILNSTIASNVATTNNGGGIRAYGVGLVLNIESSIVATNTAGNLGGSVSIAYGTCNFTNCLVQGTTDGTITKTGCITDQNPMLGPLVMNGGPTPTLALRSGSPCIDKGSNPLGLSNDQRGPAYSRVVGTVADMGAFEYRAGPTSLTYSATSFQEAMPLNNGSIDNSTPMPISIVNDVDTFTGSDGSDIAANVTMTNPPAGLTLSMIRTNNGTTVLVKLLGAATSHANANTVTNFGFIFQNGAFTGNNAASVLNSTRSDLTVTFFDPVAGGALTYSGTNFMEDAVYNDGRIDNSTPVTITLTNDSFTGNNGDVFGTNKVMALNIPPGLTAVVTRVDSKNVSLTLTNRAAAHAAANSVTNFGLAFQDSAFLGGTAAIVSNAVRSDLRVTFLDPATNVQLLYGGAVFNEAAANDGSIGTTLVIALTNDIFTGADGDDLAASNKVLVSNLPAGLTAVVTRTDFKHLNASLTGKALAHNTADSVGNLTFAFQNSAFYSTAASAVTNSSRADLAVAFLNPALTYSGTTFTESWQNDGSIGNALTISLAGDAFAGTNGEDFAGTRALASNVPAGLTPSVVRVSSNQAVFRVLGNAAQHNIANSITNLNLAFQNAAFNMGNAASVTNAARPDLAVTFVGSSPASNFYVSASTGVDVPANGTLANPWRTITYALAQPGVRADANDVINVLPGTCTESNVVVNKAVTLQGSGMDTTIVEAATQYGVAPHYRVFNLNAAGIALKDLTIRHGNHTAADSGSAIFSGGATELVMERCRVTRNNAYGGNYYYGGAIRADGRCTLRNCEVTDNTVSNQGVAGIFAWGGSLTITNCLVRGNRSMHRGGGVAAYGTSLAIADSTLASNSVALAGEWGGAVSAEGPTNVVIERCTFACNQSPRAAGALYVGVGTPTRVVNCTFYGNSGGNNPGALGDAYGGAIYFYGQNATVCNSTFFSNRVVGTIGQGGAIWNQYGTLTIASSIVASNSAPTTGPNIAGNGGVPSDNRCLIDDNAGSGISTGAPNANLSYVGTAASPVDPGLLPLADNGGPTWTCALLPNSPARNHGTNLLGLATDQRGVRYVRVYGSACDIGAFEYGAGAARGSLFLVR